MKTIKILVILLTMSGCQKGTDYMVDQTKLDKDPRTFTGIDQRLQTYVDRFTEDTSAQVTDIPVGIGVLPGNTPNHIPPAFCTDPDYEGVRDRCYQSYIAGICFIQRSRAGRYYKHIIIDGEFYEKYKDNDTKIEQLMYHELGHCVLGLEHNEETYKDGDYTWPASIMRSSLFNSIELLNYESRHNMYIDELAELPLNITGSF